MLDLRGRIPVFLRITPARVHDVNMLDQLTPEAGAFYAMDRGYLNFERHPLTDAAKLIGIATKVLVKSG